MPFSRDATQHFPRVDVLIASALTEEHQVVQAVLRTVAQYIGKNGPATLWRYSTPDQRFYTIAAVSAHAQGAIPMSVATGPWLDSIDPGSAVLIGIAAAVKTKGIELGYVPFADQVFGYGDIAIEAGELTFRNSGFQVDAKMRLSAGELRSAFEPYSAWQKECRSVINTIVPIMNSMRTIKIVPLAPADVSDPHLITGVMGSGPFLLRDADFRGKLAELPREIPETTISEGINVSGPIHPKLISAEMEAHGFMEACHQKEVPACVLKGISDLGDTGKATLEEQSGGFFRAYACSNAVLALLHMLRQFPRPPCHQHEQHRGVRAKPSLGPLDNVSAAGHNNMRVVEVFIGRDHDMAVVRNLLASHDRVAILGAPGIGKTTIALQLAKEKKQSLFVPLTTANDLTAVIRSVAIRLNIALVGQDRATEQISEAIVNRGIDLLVLDGFEHVLSARSLIAYWSRSTKVLVTTQVALGVDEYIHELKPLAEDDAIELLARRIRMRWADRRFNEIEKPLLRDLVSKLDNLPLAIELAAPLLADHEVGELIGLLDRRFDVLRMNLAPTDMPVHHHSLEATLAVSWDMLSEKQLAALSQCTVFNGSFDGKAVSSVIKLASTDPRWVVSSLVDRSLITREINPNGNIEYRLLESIRAYSLEQSGPVDADVQDRHAEHYLNHAIELYRTLYQDGSAILRANALGELRTLRSELTVIRNRIKEDSHPAALALLLEQELLRRDGPMQEWGDLSKEALQFMGRHSGLPRDIILQLVMAGLDGIIDYDRAPELIGLLIATEALKSQKGQLLAARWHNHLPRANDESSIAAVNSLFSNVLNELASKSDSAKDKSSIAEVNSALNKLASNSDDSWSVVESDDVLVATEDIWSHPNTAAPILLELAEKVDPVGAIHLARSVAWATSESSPLAEDPSDRCKMAATLLRDVAIGLCDCQAEFTCPFGLLVSEMAHYLLCYSGRSDESEQTQTISLLTTVAAAAHDRGDKRVEGLARLNRLRLANWAEKSGGAPVNDRTAEWDAIDRLLLDTAAHYLIFYEKAYWFVKNEQWEQAKKELSRILNAKTTPPLECVRALSDSALIELFLDRPYQAKSFLRNARSVMEKSRKTRAVGTGRDAMGSFFGRFAVMHALERKFSKAEKQLDQMNVCIGADGIACIYRVCVRGLEAKAGVQDVSFGEFGDYTVNAPPDQGVAVATELLRFFETLESKMRAIDCLAVRTALKLLQPMEPFSTPADPKKDSFPIYHETSSKIQNEESKTKKRKRKLAKVSKKKNRRK